VSSNSATIEDAKIRKSGLASLAIFYYDFREKQKDLHGLLTSVQQVVELVHTLTSFPNPPILLGENDSQNASDGELVRHLQELLELSGQALAYLIIDAVDEYSNTSALPSPTRKSYCLWFSLWRHDL
jgi:hypothetical protein